MELWLQAAEAAEAGAEATAEAGAEAGQKAGVENDVETIPGSGCGVCFPLFRAFLALGAVFT